MWEMAMQIFFCLLIAALLGGVIGWLLGRLGAKRQAEEARLAWAGKLTDCEARLSAANAGLRTHQQKLDSLTADLSAAQGKAGRIGDLEANLADQTSRYATLEVDCAALKRTLAEREQQVQGLTAALGACRENTASLQAKLSEGDNKIQTLMATAGAGSAVAHGTAQDAEIARLQAHIAELKAQARVWAYAAGRLPGAVPEAPADADNLEDINGVGPVLAKNLNGMGIYYFRQVAHWSEEDIDFVDSHLENFKGRIRREDWVGSAKEEHFKKYGAHL